MIIGGVAALVLVGALALLAGGGRGTKHKEAAAPVQTEDFTDRTPASEWARRAAAELARGDRQGAMHDYTRAAQAAQRDGNTDQAQRYQMHAYDIQKFTHLDEAPH